MGKEMNIAGDNDDVFVPVEEDRSVWQKIYFGLFENPWYMVAALIVLLFLTVVITLAVSNGSGKYDIPAAKIEVKKPPIPELTSVNYGAFLGASKNLLIMNKETGESQILDEAFTKSIYDMIKVRYEDEYRSANKK
jgi:hypothetical protein